jgi:hypothetical protein
MQMIDTQKRRLEAAFSVKVLSNYVLVGESLPSAAITMPAITAAAARTAMMMLLPPPLAVRRTGAPTRAATAPVGAVTASLLAAGAAAAIVGTATSDKAKTADVAILETLILKLP